MGAVLKYILFWVVFRILGRLPLGALYTIGDAAAAIGYRVCPGVRANVWDNLRHVMPNAPKSKVRKAAKQVFRNVGYYYADLAHMPHMDLQDLLDDRLILHGVRETLLPLLESGQGVVMLSAHYGNAELVMQAMIPLGQKMAAVTEPVKPPGLSRLLNEVRSSKGHEFHPVGVGGAKRIIQALRNGQAVALMGDRDIEGPRMRLPFFGQETWMPTGPIEVGLRTGCPIYPCFSARRGRFGLECWLEEPLHVHRTDDFQADVRALELQYIVRLEKRLRDEPGQWAVFERLWDAPEEAPQPEREKQKATA
jgi:lauroyl/myristoyl acyltransferase